MTEKYHLTAHLFSLKSSKACLKVFIYEGNSDAKAEEIVYSASHFLKINRVNTWLINDEFSRGQLQKNPNDDCELIIHDNGT